MFETHSDGLTAAGSYLGVGSNVGDREHNVLRALRMIEASGIAVIERVSSLYATAPVGVGPMREFVNAVARIRPLTSPEQLLERLQAVERDLGRESGHNQPREIDLDIIALGLLKIHTATLQVPHPRYRERGFVLVPLAEVDPGFRCPQSGEPVEILLSRLPVSDRVERISGRRLLSCARQTLGT